MIQSIFPQPSVVHAANLGRRRIWPAHRSWAQLLELGLSHFDVSIQLGHTDGGALVMARYGHPSVDAAKTRLLRAFQLDEREIGSEAGSNTGTN